MPPKQNILIYLLRRDLRLADNPIFHQLSKLDSEATRPYTHLLPVYVFSADQIEVSGFAKDGHPSPYAEARSEVCGFWRCGRLRAKFLAQSVWDLKTDLRRINSDLEIRVGDVSDAIQSLLDQYSKRDDVDVHGVWMTSEEGWEEMQEQKHTEQLVKNAGKEFRLWNDEKYFVDDRDLPFDKPTDLPDVFTTFRKTVEPLREAPREQLPEVTRLPPLPDYIPPQAEPFEIPDSLKGLIDALWKPLPEDLDISKPPQWPEGAKSAFPWGGGSQEAHNRVHHLVESGSMTAYKDTRNGLLGEDFSTKLSAWLALGSITARQIHWYLVDFEDGKGDLGRTAPGYGKGESKGTAAVRFELLWRDYMRLCTRKFGSRLFSLQGYRGDESARNKFISSPRKKTTNKKNVKGANDEDTRRAVERFMSGRTGIGLIDASNRELFLTGYTSNRARQNVASFLSKHLGIDWRIGAEWYETNLVDYDVSSNWGNWQYVSGVGNDPRGGERVFNPVKQALDYDPKGEYIRTWVAELKDAGRPKTGESGETPDSRESLMGVYQAWRLPDVEKDRLHLRGVDWVDKPLKRIEFSLHRHGGAGSRAGQGENRGRGKGRGRGGGYRGRGGGSRGREKGKTVAA